MTEKLSSDELERLSSAFVIHQGQNGQLIPTRSVGIDWPVPTQSQCSQVRAAIAELLELRKQNEWIPCSERMPSDNTPVLVHGGVAVHYKDAGWWTRMESPVP